MKGKTIYLTAKELSWVIECIQEYSFICEEGGVSDELKEDLKLTDKILEKLYINDCGKEFSSTLKN